MRIAKLVSAFQKAKGVAQERTDLHARIDKIAATGRSGVLVAGGERWRRGTPAAAGGGSASAASSTGSASNASSAAPREDDARARCQRR